MSIPPPPATDFDAIIVGAGLAGASAAFFLAQDRRVLVLEAALPAAGASGAAAGLANPFTGRRARPCWRHAEALDALHEVLDRSGARGLWRGGGILRPANDAKAAEHFRATATDHPDEAAWLVAAEAAARYPGVPLEEGALFIPAGGALDVGALVEAALGAAVRQGATVRTGVRVTAWGEADGAAYVEADGQGRLTARHVIVAVGQGYVAHAELTALRLHRVKGQTIRLRRPLGLPPLPHLAGLGYLVDEGEMLVAGSTYEHDFTDLQPSPAHTRAILDKMARLLPALDGAEVLDARAGARVTVPGLRRPMLGPLPGRRRVWVFTGLGARGLLTAPLLARNLPAYLHNPGTIPPEAQVYPKHS